jgi:hypothetical protein
MLNVQKLHILAKNIPLANHHKQFLFEHKTTLAGFYKKSNKKATPCEVAFHDETGSRDGV